MVWGNLPTAVNAAARYKAPMENFGFAPMPVAEDGRSANLTGGAALGSRDSFLDNKSIDVDGCPRSTFSEILLEGDTHGTLNFDRSVL